MFSTAEYKLKPIFARYNSKRYINNKSHFIFIIIFMMLNNVTVFSILTYASVNSTCAQPQTPPPPIARAIAGHLPALSVPGVGHLQILHCPRAGHLPIPGLFPSFWHAGSFLSEYNYTEGFTGKKQIGSSVKDRNNLKRAVRACSLFYAYISSLLIKIA